MTTIPIDVVMTVRRILVRQKGRAGPFALACGWLCLFASDLRWMPWRLPARMHDDVARALLGATVVIAIAAVVRGRLLYAAMRVGRDIECEARRRHDGRIADEPTVGIGVSV